MYVSPVAWSLCICNKMGGAWERCQFDMGYPYLQEKQREYYLDVMSFTVEAKTSCALTINLNIMALLVYSTQCFAWCDQITSPA